MLGLGASCVRESNQFDRAASEVKPLRVVGVDGLQQAAIGDGTSGSRCDLLNDQAVVALITKIIGCWLICRNLANKRIWWPHDGQTKDAAGNEVSHIGAFWAPTLLLGAYLISPRRVR